MEGLWEGVELRKDAWPGAAVEKSWVNKGLGFRFWLQGRGVFRHGLGKAHEVGDFRHEG